VQLDGDASSVVFAQHAWTYQPGGQPTSDHGLQPQQLRQKGGCKRVQERLPFNHILDVTGREHRPFFEPMTGSFHSHEDVMVLAQQFLQFISA
jgi:hypothetical protein